MRRFIAAVGIASILLGPAAVSAQPESRAVIAKRELSECMTRRMSANRSLSYYDALRVCKERLQPPKDTLASIGPPDPGSRTH